MGTVIAEQWSAVVVDMLVVVLVGCRTSVVVGVVGEGNMAAAADTDSGGEPAG